MTNLTRYRTADLDTLMNKIAKNTIGWETPLERFFNMSETITNYPPSNLIELSNVKSRLEVALAGFKKSEISVYTEYGKLFVEGKKEEKETEGVYVHKGIAQRSFVRCWPLSDDAKVSSVVFEDGLLTIELDKVVPEHHSRKDWL